MNDHSLNKILLGKNALCLVIEGCPSLEPTCLLPPPCPFPEGLEPALSVLLLGENGRGEGFPGGSNGKEPACNVGDLSLIPGLVRFPGEGNGYPLQYSGLENSMDRGAWQATFHGVTKRWILLSNFHFQGEVKKKYKIKQGHLQLYSFLNLS